jgi:hypothetical protein
MRPLLFVILFISLIPFVSIAQKDTFIIRTNFVNQGEQEDYWAEKLFYENYKKEIHEKYSGHIVEYNKMTFGFDSTVVLLLNDHKKLSSLFKIGLLFPGLFTGSANVQDTIKIDALEELQFLKLPLTKKRFRLWFYGKWQANPNVYLFELTNENATNQTDLYSFLKGAKLTFFKRGWRIL